MDNYIIPKEEYIWWRCVKNIRDQCTSGPNNTLVNDMGESPQPLLHKFLEKWIGYVHFPEMTESGYKNYLSKYFSTLHEFPLKKKIFICTNHDVGLKKLTEEDVLIMRNHPSWYLYKFDIKKDMYVFQNPQNGLQYPRCFDSFDYIPDMIYRIYAKALRDKNDKLVAIPNGINSEHVLERINFMHDDLFKRPNKERKLLYLSDCTMGTNAHRHGVMAHFSSLGWATVGTKWFNGYLEDVYEHSFQISMVGNCADNHRVWESLYLGTIPIVIRTKEMEHFSDLPILMVDNWNEVTEELLNKKLIEFNNRKWNMEKIKMSYWLNMIEKDAKICRGDIK